MKTDNWCGLDWTHELWFCVIDERSNRLLQGCSAPVQCYQQSTAGSEGCACWWFQNQGELPQPFVCHSKKDSVVRETQRRIYSRHTLNILTLQASLVSRIPNIECTAPRHDFVPHLVPCCMLPRPCVAGKGITKYSCFWLDDSESCNHIFASSNQWAEM